MADETSLPIRGRPVDENARRDRRQQILTGARACFVAKGFHAASMSDIATKAGVSNANIYQYYNNKEALIIALISDQMKIDAELINLVVSTQFQPGRMREVLKPYFSSNLGVENAVLMCERLSEASRNPAVGKLSANADAQTIQVLDHTVRDAQARGLIPGDVDPPSAAITISLVFDGILRLLLNPASNRKDLLDMMIDQIRRALKQPDRMERQHAE